MSQFRPAPSGTTIGGDLDSHDIGFARPSRAMHGHFTSLQVSAVAWARNDRLHAQASHRVRIFRLYGVARLHWLIWQAVIRDHKNARKFRVEHFNFGEPFAGGCTNPAGDESARRESVMLGKGGSVHVGGDQGVGVERFLDRNAADEGRNFTRNFIEAAQHDVLAGGLNPGALQNIAQTWASEPRSSDSPLAPLYARDLRAMQAASVAGALERVDNGVRLEFLKLGQLQRQRFLHLAAQREAPVVGIEFA